MVLAHREVRPPDEGVQDLARRSLHALVAQVRYPVWRRPGDVRVSRLYGCGCTPRPSTDRMQCSGMV